MGPTQFAEAVINAFASGLVVSKIDKKIVEAVESRFFQNFHSLWSDGLERWKPRALQQPIVSGLETFGTLKGKVVANTESNFPSGLLKLGEAKPSVLWLRGKTSFLNESLSVGLVGSRNSTPYGRRVAVDLVAEAVGNNIVTVSGGAFGIDSTVHKATLTDGGETVSIMAGGLDSLYPSSNRELFQEILAEGLLVAEVPPGVKPTKWRFLQRNRLIAAWSKATIVVEAGSRSGALNTAHHAFLLERPVGVVPGPITSATSVGSNELVRLHPDMVQLVTNVSDLKYLCANRIRPPEVVSGLGELETRALDAVGSQHKSQSEIQVASGMTTSQTRLAVEALVASRHLVEVLGKYKKPHLLLPAERANSFSTSRL
ncbi:MAG: DNA-processing protein DprA [Micrococcales bacterium]